MKQTFPLKLSFTCIFFFSIYGLIFAENLVRTETWLILEQGNVAFDKGELGDALANAQKAQNMHKEEIVSSVSILEKALSPAEIKKEGDDIQSVRTMLEKREDTAAVEIVDSILQKYPSSFFGDSVQKMLEWLRKNEAYPECDILTARVYEAEGEYDLAAEYYDTAWKNRDLFDIPDDSITLAYRIADLAERIGKYGIAEDYLKKILETDPVFGKDALGSPTLQAMLRTLKTEKTIDKFFSLYRHDNFTGFKAMYTLAAFYYSKSGRAERAIDVAALAACTAMTWLIEGLQKYDPAYVYSDLPDLLTRTGNYQELVDWAERNNLYQTLFLLAEILSDRGYRDQSVHLWTVMAMNSPDPDIAQLSKARLQTGS